MAFDSWESYFYPETIDRLTSNGTLCNLYGLRDAAELHDREYAATARRQVELASGIVKINKTYDPAHLCAIHQHLFQDIYEWAGEYRTVNMTKGTPRGFADVTNGEIDRYLRDVNAMVSQTRWNQLDHEQFATQSATVFSYLNQAHPFQEGNGRTAKIFMEHVAELSRFQLDFSRVSPARWNVASMLSGPDRFSYKPHSEELVPVFREAAQPRRAGMTSPCASTQEKSCSLRSATFPKSPQQIQDSADIEIQQRPNRNQFRGPGYENPGMSR